MAAISAAVSSGLSGSRRHRVAAVTSLFVAACCRPSALPFGMSTRRHHEAREMRFSSSSTEAGSIRQRSSSRRPRSRPTFTHLMTTVGSTPESPTSPRRQGCGGLGGDRHTTNAGPDFLTPRRTCRERRRLRELVARCPPRPVRSAPRVSAREPAGPEPPPDLGPKRRQRSGVQTASTTDVEPGWSGKTRAPVPFQWNGRSLVPR